VKKRIDAAVTAMVSEANFSAISLKRRRVFGALSRFVPLLVLPLAMK
jgi:hypothetical protein